MTAVVDASVVVAYLVGDPGGSERAAIVAGAHAPEFVDVEVTHALRGLVRAGAVDAERAAIARHDLAQLSLVRHPDRILLDGAWALRDRCTTYDALYVALAQGLGATLHTRDLKLARGIDGVVPTSTG